MTLSRVKKGLYVIKDAAGNTIDTADRIDSAMNRADKKGVPCMVVHVLSGKIVRPLR